MADKRVRILGIVSLDGFDYQPNDVVVFGADIAARLAKDGMADSSKEAVEYCLTELAVEEKQHPVMSVKKTKGKGAAPEHDPAPDEEEKPAETPQE